MPTLKDKELKQFKDNFKQGIYNVEAKKGHAIDSGYASYNKESGAIGIYQFIPHHQSGGFENFWKKNESYLKSLGIPKPTHLKKNKDGEIIGGKTAKKKWYKENEILISHLKNEDGAFQEAYMDFYIEDTIVPGIKSMYKEDKNLDLKPGEVGAMLHFDWKDGVRNYAKGLKDLKPGEELGVKNVSIGQYLERYNEGVKNSSYNKFRGIDRKSTESLKEGTTADGFETVTLSKNSFTDEKDKKAIYNDYKTKKDDIESKLSNGEIDQNQYNHAVRSLNQELNRNGNVSIVNEGLTENWKKNELPQKTKEYNELLQLEKDLYQIAKYGKQVKAFEDAEWEEYQKETDELINKKSSWEYNGLSDEEKGKLDREIKKRQKTKKTDYIIDKTKFASGSNFDADRRKVLDESVKRVQEKYPDLLTVINPKKSEKGQSLRTNEIEHHFDFDALDQIYGQLSEDLNQGKLSVRDALDEDGNVDTDKLQQQLKEALENQEKQQDNYVNQGLNDQIIVVEGGQRKPKTTTSSTTETETTGSGDGSGSGSNLPPDSSGYKAKNGDYSYKPENLDPKEEEEFNPNYAQDEIDAMMLESDKPYYDPSEYKSEFPLTDILTSGVGIIKGAKMAKTKLPERDEQVSDAYRAYAAEVKKLSEIGLRPEDEAYAKRNLTEAYQGSINNIRRASAGNRNLILGNQGRVDAQFQKGLVQLAVADAQAKDANLQKYGEAMKYISEFDSKRDIANHSIKLNDALRKQQAGADLMSTAFSKLQNDIQYYRENKPGSANHMYKTYMEKTMFGDKDKIMAQQALSQDKAEMARHLGELEKKAKANGGTWTREDENAAVEKWRAEHNTQELENSLTEGYVKENKDLNAINEKTKGGFIQQISQAGKKVGNIFKGKEKDNPKEEQTETNNAVSQALSSKPEVGPTADSFPGLDGKETTTTQFGVLGNKSNNQSDKKPDYTEALSLVPDVGPLKENQTNTTQFGIFAKGFNEQPDYKDAFASNDTSDELNILNHIEF